MRSALLLLALFAGGAVGCVNNDATMSIIQMQAVSEMTNCVASGTPGIGLSHGTLDVNQSNHVQGYIGFPVVRNNQESRKPSADSPELNSIQLLGANVSLSFPDPAAGKNVPDADRKFFWASAGGRIDPAGGAPLQIEVVPINVVNEIKMTLDAGATLVEVIAEIKPVGMETSDRIVGGPIFFPVDLCENCLINSLGTCPLPHGTVVPATCIPGQDAATNCCTNGGTAECGGNVTIASTTSPVAQPPSN